MQRITFITSLLICALTCGCNPYRFTVETQHPVDCRIFSDHQSVNSHLYGFDMYPNAVVQVTSLAWTQYDLGVYLTISRGEGFQILLRPVIEEQIIDSGLIVTFLSNGGMRLDSAGHMLEENRTFRFPKDSQVYVTIYNEEAFLQMTVGCDTILKHVTKRKSSDDIALKTLPGSSLKVLEPQWKRIKFTKDHDGKVEQPQ